MKKSINRNEQIIFLEKSGTSRCIKVLDNGKQRWLTFNNNYFQSLINKKKPYTPLMKYLPHLCLNLPTTQQQSSLIFGVAGGSIYHYLKHYHPKLLMTLVEIEPALIDIAKQYFSVDLPIIQADAFEHIKNCQQYDHIIIDIFIKKSLPEILLNGEFFTHCKKQARSSISINLLSHTFDDLAKMVHVIRDVFEDKTICLPVNKNSNLVCHAYTGADHLTIIQRYYEQQLIRKPQWHPKLGMLAGLQP